MAKDIYGPENTYKKLMSYTHNGTDDHKQVFHSSPDQIARVKLRPNKDVPSALFKPDPLIPGGYIAHPTTISAVRKEIFMGGEDFIDLELLYICTKCQHELDLQFWNFCPYCEASFPKEIIKK
jgi:hypothetical protein